MDCVVSPVDQKLSIDDDEVKITEPPSQNVVGPLAEMVGVAGVGFTVTVSLIEFPEEQPFSITSTVKFPEVVTVMNCVVSPVDHKLSVADDEVKTTDPPEQKVVTPLAVIVGTEGNAFTVIPIGEETAEHKPLSTVTEYEPEAKTVIDCVISPVDHKLSIAEDEVRTTEPPEQKVVTPLAVIVGTEGSVFTVIPIGEETAEHKPLSTVTE